MVLRLDKIQASNITLVANAKLRGKTSFGTLMLELKFNFNQNNAA